MNSFFRAGFRNMKCVILSLYVFLRQCLWVIRFHIDCIKYSFLSFFFLQVVTTDECRLEQEETRASCQTKASISIELDPSTGVLDEYVCVIEDETASLGSLSDTDRISVIELDCLNHSGDSSGCETYSQDGGIRVISPVQSDLFNLQVLVLQNQLAFESEADSGTFQFFVFRFFHDTYSLFATFSLICD